MSENLDNEKVLKQLKVSYDMYEKSKKETEKKMKETVLEDGTKKYTKEQIQKQLDLLTVAQDDVVDQYIACGGKEEDIRKKTRKTSISLDKLDKNEIHETIKDMMANMETDRQIELKKSEDDIIYSREEFFYLVFPPEKERDKRSLFEIYLETINLISGSFNIFQNVLLPNTANLTLFTFISHSFTSGFGINP